MDEKNTLNAAEKELIQTLRDELEQLENGELTAEDNAKIHALYDRALEEGVLCRDAFGLHPMVTDYQTAIIVATEIGVMRGAILGVLLNGMVSQGVLPAADVEQEFGKDVAVIVHGLARIKKLYEKNPIVESENFRQLLLSFAEDMRVILIVIASRVCVMRNIKESENDEARRHVATEAAYLYAPLAHKLGLYKLKSELEDLSLK